MIGVIVFVSQKTPSTFCSTVIYIYYPERFVLLLFIYITQKTLLFIYITQKTPSTFCSTVIYIYYPEDTEHFLFYCYLYILPRRHQALFVLLLFIYITQKTPSTFCSTVIPRKKTQYFNLKHTNCSSTTSPS